ncbi:hypothetical protein [Bacillus sp. ISL-45]|uniref:hypothetical protein n=1 Tax=Bacillus sp. ISL-45 TaxID=2819128 RepID=UPI001BE7EFDB|nr:hypothetical protein [Bacillus sp. ISL-45]MBT2663195.1 hypothetical protein [Bacillus sp. ISL-45]
MTKRIRLLMIIGIAFLGGYFLNIHLKDDTKEIKRIVHTINEPLLSMAHVEFLDKNHAVAFYETVPTGELYFGTAIFKKGILGWESVGSFSSQIPKDKKLDWGYSGVKQDGFGDFTDLIRGKILSPEIEKVKVVTKEGNEYEARIIEYNNSERFWFLISKGEELLGATILGISKDGKILEEL